MHLHGHVTASGHATRPCHGAERIEALGRRGEATKVADVQAPGLQAVNDLKHDPLPALQEESFLQSSRRETAKSPSSGIGAKR